MPETEELRQVRESIAELMPVLFDRIRSGSLPAEALREELIAQLRERGHDIVDDKEARDVA